MWYTLGMRYLIIIIFGLLMAGCTFHIKAEKLDLEGKPIEPQLKMSNTRYELESIDILKKEI